MLLAAAATEAQEAAELDDGTTMTVHLEPGLDEIFEEGTRRLLGKSTWKLWQWLPEDQEFFDADSFRSGQPSTCSCIMFVLSLLSFR